MIDNFQIYFNVDGVAPAETVEDTAEEPMFSQKEEEVGSAANMLELGLDPEKAEKMAVKGAYDKSIGECLGMTVDYDYGDSPGKEFARRYEKDCNIKSEPARPVFAGTDKGMDLPEESEDLVEPYDLEGAAGYEEYDAFEEPEGLEEIVYPNEAAAFEDIADPDDYIMFPDD